MGFIKEMAGTLDSCPLNMGCPLRGVITVLQLGTVSQCPIVSI